MRDENDQAYEVAGPEVISKDFGDEVVVANLDTGIFYSLNEAGSAIWLHLEAGGSLRDLARANGDGDALGIRPFVEALVAEQLLAPSRGIRQSSVDPARHVLSAPAFERFEDLQGLLLVDPIHEASGAGWPLRP